MAKAGEIDPKVLEEALKAAQAKMAEKPETPTGSGDDFILAWGRSNALSSILKWVCIFEGLVILGLAVLVGWLAYRNEKKETWVFVKDSLGNVVQADPSGFLRAGDTRSEVDIKSFAKNWAIDAFTWTPLDVQDRLKKTLLLVDDKAKASAKETLRIEQRAKQVQQGFSGRVYDDPKMQDKEPTVLILNPGKKPIEVLVTLDRYVIAPDGTKQEMGRIHVNLVLKEVPRNPDNLSGLLIVDARGSEKL